ncbi:hypothetical protein [Pontibacter fetidus]|uniref:Uncharacterized protein n=1 Tax=Pontibacter fetidus TaxID=2700082 RepID=A0A6B2GX23_9BACT|nr:hypothetical protein [Pontibacter fetidus]NDK54408.1 hypothetical protein [Pontibacter fetidus]
MKKVLFLAAVAAAFTTSCTSVNRTMREPNTHVELVKSDFTYSDQVSAEASSTKILGIDFERILKAEGGSTQGGGNVNIASIPVIGNMVADRTANYALYNLMVANPGYDVVFYPQYETKVVKPILGIGLLTKITKVKTTARLARINANGSSVSTAKAQK